LFIFRGLLFICRFGYTLSSGLRYGLRHGLGTQNSASSISMSGFTPERAERISMAVSGSSLAK